MYYYTPIAGATAWRGLHYSTRPSPSPPTLSERPRRHPRLGSSIIDGAPVGPVARATEPRILRQALDRRSDPFSAHTNRRQARATRLLIPREAVPLFPGPHAGSQFPGCQQGHLTLHACGRLNIHASSLALTTRARPTHAQIPTRQPHTSYAAHAIAAPGPAI